MRLVCFYWHPQNSMKRPSAQTAGCRTLHTQPISNYSQPQRLRPKATEQLICSVHFSGHNLQDQESCNLIGCSHFHSFTLWFSATLSRLKKKKIVLTIISYFFYNKYLTYLVGVSADLPRSDDVIGYKHLQRSALADKRQTVFVGDGEKTRAFPGQIIRGVKDTYFLHLTELKILLEGKI